MALVSGEKVLLGATAEPLSAVSLTCAQVFIQAKRSNNAAIEVGGSTLVSGKGMELAIPVTDTPLEKFPIRGRGGNPINLSHIYVIGTMGDGVNFFYEEY